MSWMEFISSLVSSLAWPAAIAFIAFLLRRQLRGLFTGLRFLRWKGAEAEFERSVQVAEATAEEAELPAAVAPDQDLGTTDIETLIEIAPRAAVIEAWLQVQRELRELAKRAGLDERTIRRSPSQIAQELAQRGIIATSMARLIRELYQVRTLAAHEDVYAAGQNEVADYALLAQRTASYLSGLAANLEPAEQEAAAGPNGA